MVPLAGPPALIQHGNRSARNQMNVNVLHSGKCVKVVDILQTKYGISVFKSCQNPFNVDFYLKSMK